MRIGSVLRPVDRLFDKTNSAGTLALTLSEIQAFRLRRRSNGGYSMLPDEWRSDCPHKLEGRYCH